MAVAARQPAPPVRERAVPFEYRRILVPLAPASSSLRAMNSACRLAAEHGALVTVVCAIEVPAELPLDAHMIEEEEHARAVLRRAEQIGDSRDVAEAERSRAELVVLAAARRPSLRRRSPGFGETASYVLQNAPCRVLVSVRHP